MDIYQFIFVVISILVLATVLYWIPKSTKELFGTSTWGLVKLPTVEFSKQLEKAICANRLRPVQTFYNLPMHQWLVVDHQGKRLLLDVGTWQRDPDGNDWFKLEQQRLHTCADEAWLIRPNMSGQWAGWLSQAKLGNLKPTSLSQFLNWLNHQKEQPNS